MKTSYFGSTKWKGLNTVAISQGVPTWYEGRVYRALAPSWELVKLTDTEEYAKRYKCEVLSRLDPQKVLEDLGDNAILLCWEKAGEFCHRRLVAEWLNETLGMEVEELGAKPVEQLSIL